MAMAASDTAWDWSYSLDGSKDHWDDSYGHGYDDGEDWDEWGESTWKYDTWREKGLAQL